ncbi:MAG: terpene cyclase/mutase family protein [Planctomycetia bacterium]|nr:terpene cyclase/mutase family protein [Planctomycetia bacterium]
MSALVLLGLLWLPTRADRQVHLEASTYAEELGDQLIFDSPLAGNDPDKVEEPLVTPDKLPEVDDPFAAPAKMEVLLEGSMATSDLQAPQIGLALRGRSEGMKKSLLGRFGGTETTESAVHLGLKWLVRNQQKTGQWSLTGPYDNGGSTENEEAATSLALLAFQGAGHTHQGEGEFNGNVRRGWAWLLKRQDADGSFYHDGGMNHRYYTQGQCAIALCELYAMTKDDKLREPAQRAIRYLLDSQSPMGGWKYQPRVNSDVSVTGWVVMALQSARMAGIEIPPEHFQRVERFLDQIAQEDGSRYPYELGRMATPAMTAEALLCRQYLGWARDDPRLVRGVEWITSPGNLINYDTNRNVYFWYYATQVAHHMEGEYWKRWNAVMRQAVPERQSKRGREAGSWPPAKDDLFDVSGGRLYVTCLSIYMLEVYYRHLPIYTGVYLGR